MSDEAAEEVIAGLSEGGIDFVSLLPESAFLPTQYRAIKKFQYVVTCNETSGVAICAGAWLGGKKPAMLMATPGLAVATYALAGVCLREGIPVLLVLPGHDIGDKRWFSNIWYSHTMEPLLETLKLPYITVGKVSEVRRTIREACTTCFAWMKPFAVILRDEVMSRESH